MRMSGRTYTEFQISEKSMDVGGVNIAYTDTGPQDGRVLLCVHGLLSNGRDYDFLARHMASRGYRVLSVDLPGRGRSDQLSSSDLYILPTYIPYILSVIAAEIGTKPFDWLGVSLGGMIAMACHAMDGINLERIILVDIGAEISAQALDRIAKFAKLPIEFTNKEDAVAFLKMRCASWGITDEAIWDHLITYNLVERYDGRYCLHYDSAIGVAINDTNETVVLWDSWGQIKQHVLLIRGEESDLLPTVVAQKMIESYQGKSIKEIVFEGCGHVPNLMQTDHIEVVAAWLCDG